VTRHLVQFSTGMSSAEVAWRLVAEHGPEDVICLTADTLKEDEDNWRFGGEVVNRLGCEWVKLTDGRTPMQLGRDHRMIPSDRMPACSASLKRKVIRAWCKASYDPAESIMYLGYDWSEPGRVEANRRRQRPWPTIYPLTQPPFPGPLDVLFRSRGIDPPRLYAYGFPHANCGGACVRGGLDQWRLLLAVNRPRYLEWEAEEEESRRQVGDHAILADRTGPGPRRPLPLRVLREREDARGEVLFSVEGDWGACGCEMPGDEDALDGEQSRQAKADRWSGSSWEPLTWPVAGPMIAASP
jgi:hypothetical protein